MSNRLSDPKTLTLTGAVLVGLAILGWIAGVSQAATAPAAGTLANLQEAFNGESNAHARYLAFAEKADQEGYTKVASIFRAAARAESIHANNHAQVIRTLGAEPTATIETPVVKSTAENLRAAIDGESYERDTMYPEFLATAKKERQKDALRSFNFAKEAEGGHAELYTQALASLDTMTGDPLELKVCPECGRTVTSLDGEKCPVCFTPNEKFISVS
jgi:rubrerythrin